MHNFLPVAYFKNQFVPFSEANISIATHALHYGTAAFGGLRAIPSSKNPNEILLFRLDKHAKRLSDSAKFLGVELSPEKIQDLIIEFIRQNKPQKPIYIRPLVYTSDLGIAPRLHDIETDFLIYGLELGDYLAGDGIRVCFSSWQRQADSSFPLRGKITGGYITSSLAKTEAVSRGFDEALLINNQGKVCEGSAMNLFLVRNNQLITPSVDQDILEGITRKSILDLAKDMGIETIQRPVDKTELLIAEEVFLTGTAAKISPIKSIENYILPVQNPLTKSLQQKLSQIVVGEDQEYEKWIWKVEL